MEEKFVTPPGHVGFVAKKLFGGSGEMLDCAVARLERGGGGPVEPHAHPHDHLFIVISGRARIVMEDEEHILHEGEGFRVEGRRLHSVWNDADGETVMVGISVKGR